MTRTSDTAAVKIPPVSPMVRDRMSSRARELLTLAIIAISGVGLRAVSLLKTGIDFAVAPDSVGYIGLADGLRKGCGFARLINGACSAPEILRTPGFPLMLAGIPNLRYAIAVQAFIGGGLSFCLGRFVWRRWGSKAGIAAALLVALDVPSIIASSYILTETLFTGLFVAAVLIQMSLIWRRKFDSAAVALGLLAAIMLGYAALVRPIGQIYVLLAPLPFFFMSELSRKRKVQLSALALILPLLLVGAWIGRNGLERGWYGESAIQAENVYLYRAAGVIWYRQGSLNIENFHRIQDRLTNDLCAANPDYCKTADGLREMQKRGMQICLSDIPAVAVVSLASFIYVSVTPYSSQLYNVLDVPRLKADSFNHRYREILGSPSIVLLTGLCALMVLFLWSGIFRFVLHFDRNSADVLVLYPLILGLSMIALAAGPEAVDFRLRVPSIPFLAIVAAVGWFRDRRSPVRIPS